ncbi:hypothetical protein HDV63DRAFT_132639 [Trichoderma sp. SZMC 28014]
MGLRGPPPLVHVLSFLLRPVRIPNAGKQGRRRDVLHEANGGVAPGLEMMMRVNMLHFLVFRDVVAMAGGRLLGCCATSMSILCNLRARMVLPSGIICHPKCGQSQEIVQFRIQTEGETDPDLSRDDKDAHPAAETEATRRGTLAGRLEKAPSPWQRLALRSGTAAAKEWASSAVQMRSIWDPASHLFFIQKLSHGRCRSRFGHLSFPFFFIVFAALALIEARLDAAPTLVILFSILEAYVRERKFISLFTLRFTLLYRQRIIVPLPQGDLSVAF